MAGPPGCGPVHSDWARAEGGARRVGVVRDPLRVLAHHLGMMRYLWAMPVLLKDFADHAESVTRQLRETSEAHARQIGRPVLYMPSSAASKEDQARTIALRHGIEQELAPAKAGA